MPALSELVSVRTRYRRAVNLSTDSHDARALDDILVTPLIAHALERLLTNLESPQGERSFMIFGPYGAGKSTFALFINALFSMGAHRESQAYAALRKTSPELVARFLPLCATKRPWFCVPLTARRSPIGQIILEGLQGALGQLPDDTERQAVSRRLETSLRHAGWRDSAAVLDLVEAVRKLALARERSGFLLIVDEAGKSLEYALQDKAGGDVYLFQMLAEHAKRVPDAPMLFLTVQHQHFDGYTELSNTILRHEWAKVQDRFEPLSFNEQLASGLNTLGQVLQYPHPLPNPLLATILLEAQALLEAGVELPAGMTAAEFTQICQRAWPLHPSVILVLPLLFRRLAQNERSLFSYLASQEPHGFQEHCRRDLETDNGFVRLHDIADYLLTNMTATLVQRPAARILLETLENGDNELTPLQSQTLRTVGLLNVLGPGSPMKATQRILAASLPQSRDVPETLQGLRRREQLTFRQMDKTFRLWEGGSIDIEALLQKARKQLRCEGPAFLELVREHVPTRPLVARKHCLQSGAYRFFDLEYALSATDFAPPQKGRTSCEAGRILVLLPMNDQEQLEKEALQATLQEPSLVVAIPYQLDMLRQPAIELACLRWVAKQTPALRGDRRALREYSLLLADCERRIRQNADLLLDPRPAPRGNACRWFWQGSQQPVRHPADVTRLLSQVCDSQYPCAPRIRNELVARPALSSAGTAARNILLKRMLTHAAQENLGIDGFPPERSMYESVLRGTGLHGPAEDGLWTLCEPDEGSNLYAVWQVLEHEIYATPGECIPLPRIFQKLVSPPYGVPEGLLPILLLAFYLCRTSELFLYREGSFLTHLDEAGVELMQRRPDLFGISGVRLEGERRALVVRYAAGLHVAATVPAVVSRLYAAIRQLPPLTQQTSKLNPRRGKALRDRFRTARSPERLLFEELPEAFGLPSLLAGGAERQEAAAFAAAMRESMGELMDFAPRTRARCRDVFLHACGLPSGDSGWHGFVERAEFLARRIRRGAITPVLERASRAESNEDHRLEGVLGIVYGRAFERWSDTDVAAFMDAAQGMGEQFRRAWEDYGSAFLNSEEQKLKERIRVQLAEKLAEIQADTSPRVMAEALRELLRDVESDHIRESKE